MIRIPSAEGGCPPLPNTTSADIEAALRAQLEDDRRVLALLLATPEDKEHDRG